MIVYIIRYMSKKVNKKITLAKKTKVFFYGTLKKLKNLCRENF